MSRYEENPGGVPRPATVKARGRDELVQWVNSYRASVGAAADPCVDLLQGLLDDKALAPSAIDPLLELLEILESLLADPVTISCAMVHVAGQRKEVDSAIIKMLPGQVRRQLDELNKLKHYESGQSENSTERSAEGLRRLLLALVNDVRVVLIDLSWQLVLLHRAKTDSELG